MEITLVDFVFYVGKKKKKGSVISRALRLHNPSHNRLSHQEPHRLENETHYHTPVKDIFAKVFQVGARGAGGRRSGEGVRGGVVWRGGGPEVAASQSVSLKHRIRSHQTNVTHANSQQL